ncbi:serine hydrolase domain-containing protein [Legionella cardiaca]|uniref:Serine hydrolase n=1 Tax=Legionella cardiaca TaxID=1071983 RepID=A0ABY8AQZ0_9GAMM|nr:serine hydrolase domain-containing protein [Legionella cardiaca]WED42854.1 serine hydrolase [Legionella cardiaca]
MVLNKLDWLGYCVVAAFLLIGNVFATCSENLNEGIQTIIERDRLQYKIPGIEVSISCSDEDIPHDFVSGTTTIDGSISIRPDHLFQIGSETKSFIAAIILQLEEEGALSIHDPVGNYLEDMPITWQNVTIQQLLNHSSGIVNYTDVLDVMGHEPDFDFLKSWSSRELINLVLEKPLYFSPGTGWHYSNTNYVLAGMVIEKITGRPIEETITNKIITPLQLTNTYYLSSLYNDDMLQRMAHGYSDRGYFPDEPKDITGTNISWANTAGAMIANSHDMAIWFRHLMNGSVLASAQMDELMTVVDATLPNTAQKIDYGLGVVHDFDTFSEEAWWHSGGTLGYSALMVWLKEENIVITANLNHVTATRDSYELMKHLVAFIKNAEA